jgi:hypothetical protein
LGAVEIARCEERHTRVKLGGHKRTIPSRPNSPPKEQNRGCTGRITRWAFRRSLGD